MEDTGLGIRLKLEGWEAAVVEGVRGTLGFWLLLYFPIKVKDQKFYEGCATSALVWGEAFSWTSGLALPLLDFCVCFCARPPQESDD